MAITVCQFSKIFWRSIPPDPLESFLLLKLLKINSAGENYAWKRDKIWCFLPEKILEYASDMKQFQKGLFTPVFGSLRLCI